MKKSSQFDTLRGQHQAVLDYEQAREKRRGPRTARELRPHLQTLDRHLAQWERIAQATGGTEKSPLLPLRAEWREIVGIPETEPEEPNTRPKKGKA